MFPFNPETIFQLVLIGVALSSALAFRFGWRWRIPLLLVAIALPTGFLWSGPPTGQYAGLGYLLVGGISIIVLVFGAGWGGIMRLVGIAPLTSIVVTTVATTSTVSFALWYQYVPSACLDASLQVRIAGKSLHLPPELRPRLAKGNNIGHFGRIDRKSDFARFCRMSRNGARAIDMDTVLINPASNHRFMTSACNVDDPPDWCSNYSSDPYRYTGMVHIAPETEPAFPLPYWQEGGSIEKDRKGDLTQGSVCLLPDADIRTQCWTWQPFGEGARLTVSTNNLDRAFDDMPIEDAREMIRLARDITLNIIE